MLRAIAYSFLFLLLPGVVVAEAPFRMEGTVSEVDTGEPVGGAEVQVFIQSERELERRIRKASTDDQGRYSVDLPAGHAWAWAVVPPVGYCTTDHFATEVFATTADQPVFRKDYQVGRGTPIRLAVEYPDETSETRDMHVALNQQVGDKFIHGSREVDEHGACTITLPRLSGMFNVVCGDLKRTLTAEATADFENGFDPNNVQADIERGEDEKIVVRDAAGRVVTLRGCSARTENKQLTIVLRAKLTAAGHDIATVRGRIVDENSRGIAGATIEVALHSTAGGSATSGIQATSDQQGHYSVRVPGLDRTTKISLVVSRDGFAGTDTEPYAVPDSPKPQLELKPITLRRGSSIRIRTVGPRGESLVGAIVQPTDTYAARERIGRTNAEAECLLTDLPSGLMRVSAQFGELSAHTKIPLEPGENELVVLKLTPPPAPAPTTKTPPSKARSAVGKAAPEWKIAEWSDGRERNLADYRGKTVVLDFWGIWCGPCIQMIPAMKQLHERYHDRDVVFVGIHTAGTDIALVKRLLKIEKWDLTVGLDDGTDVAAGQTVNSYAIQGFPSVVIIDPNGVVAFNSDMAGEDPKAIMLEMERLAKLAGVPWPLDKETPENEIIERINHLHLVMLSEAIDKTLKAPAKP